MTQNYSQSRIESLQALRWIAFLGIFFTHAVCPVNWATLSVSFFFVLSGYLCQRFPKSAAAEPSLKNNLLFSWRKIRRLYPLHIVTMLAALLLNLLMFSAAGYNLRDLAGEFAKLLALNITLLQSWIPSTRINTSLNGVAWYLSVMVFLYFMFPWISRGLGKIKRPLLPVLAAGVLALQLLLGLPAFYHPEWGGDRCIWLIYTFPVMRLGDFVVGMLLGQWQRERFRDNSDAPAHEGPESFEERNVRKCSLNRPGRLLIELAVFAVTFFALRWLQTPNPDPFPCFLQSHPFFYVILSVLWIYLGTENAGPLMRALSNPLFVWLGNLSGEMFLIHFVVTSYIQFYCLRNGLNPAGWKLALVIAGELAITVALSCLWQLLQKRIHKSLYRK